MISTSCGSFRDRSGQGDTMMEATFELLLKLPHIRVLRVEQTNAGAYMVTVESTLKHTTCHTCQRRIDTFYRLDDAIMLQHLPMCGSKVFIRLQPKRFRCPFCSDKPTTTQELAWYRPRSQLTKAYEDTRKVLEFKCNCPASAHCPRPVTLRTPSPSISMRHRRVQISTIFVSSP